MQTEAELLNELKAALLEVLKIEKMLGNGTKASQGIIGRLAEIVVHQKMPGSTLAPPGQEGYDIIAEDGTTISVKGTASKTTTKVGINKRTCHLAEETIVVEFDDDYHPEYIFYGPTKRLIPYCTSHDYKNSKLEWRISRKELKVAHIDICSKL